MAATVEVKQAIIEQNVKSRVMEGTPLAAGQSELGNQHQLIY
jgi:hypothetical protein